MSVKKGNFEVYIKVKGKDKKIKGHLYLTSGNLYYTRPNGKQDKCCITYQQLIDLLEEHAVFE